MEPELLICDEVVSALDVSVQGQILNLLLDIRARRDMSFLFIAHDLKVACYFCDRIGVMYRGELMEEAPAAMLYSEALHPYTQVLFSSACTNEKETFKSVTPAKTPAVSHNTAAKYCSFAPRCPQADKRCFNEHPEFTEIKNNHFIRCFYHAAADVSPCNT
jgi:oligopeptide/dipeptide ABC transporter ATP-binding protein